MHTLIGHSFVVQQGFVQTKQRLEKIVQMCAVSTRHDPVPLPTARLQISYCLGADWGRGPTELLPLPRRLTIELMRLASATGKQMFRNLTADHEFRHIYGPGNELLRPFT